MVSVTADLDSADVCILAIDQSNADYQSNADCQRARKLKQARIDFIPHENFASDPRVENPLVSQTLSAPRDTTNTPRELPAHLQRMCETELLSHEQESALFRQMNFLKFQAVQLQGQLDPEQPDESLMNGIDSFVRRAHEIRDYILMANMRLVMSIAKKFVNPQQSFDDMLSEGSFTLMQAVEKFDFDRGFRFSTYAYRSIARTAFRAVTTAQKEEARVTRDADEWAFEDASVGRASSMTDQVWSNLRELTASMLKELDQRERFIIRSRYALGSHRKVRTFQCLADKLGVSKERVRQLEQRAVSKLQKMAGQFEMDDLFGAAMV